ncbi:hypothetical protein TRFO_09831 [Tritrichomonas foetus]|uniref:Uncharacterized protein n=1 Tax=Tritrichomonas foetus TaxID=1144522 RepID=A0A1J4JBU9_9EUKA|nr:hypothetical protein TRFO_09831 [Tritrichomonas foetus]|eukprot:OHS96674.1 hypothetical protein TRFO_09831 [Tritrichomonas foetus]
MQKPHEYRPQMPSIDDQPRYTARRFRRKKVNVNEFTERDRNIRMANNHETETEFTRRTMMESDARRYTPSRDAINHYFWARSNISPADREKMSQNVDIYMKKLKASRPKREKTLLPRELKLNEIPADLHGPWSDHVAPRVSRRISREFDKSDYYKSQSKPLTPVQTDHFVFKAFREYIENNQERVPSILFDEIEQKLSQMKKESAGQPRKRKRIY